MARALTVEQLVADLLWYADGVAALRRNGARCGRHGAKAAGAGGSVDKVGDIERKVAHRQGVRVVKGAKVQNVQGRRWQVSASCATVLKSDV